MAANYDLNEVADALAARFNGRAVMTIGGLDVPLNAYSEVAGDPFVPGIVVDLDDVDWDITMARGADAFTFLLIVLLQGADTTNGQRVLRSALSTGGIGTRVKDALDEDKTLGGLVSYAEMVGTRNVGQITYAGQDYIGVELIIEVVAQ